MSFEYHKVIVENLDFTMLYPPEGDSSILEVTADIHGAFLHVSLAPDKTLVFAFFPEKKICLSENQLLMITEKARKNLSLTDSSLFE